MECSLNGDSCQKEESSRKEWNPSGLETGKDLAHTEPFLPESALGPLIKFLSPSQRAEEATFNPVHLYLAKNKNSHSDSHHSCMPAARLTLH